MQPKLLCGHVRIQDNCSHCRALQTFWYKALKATGFDDAENTKRVSRPLKVWTGISLRVTPRGSEESIDVIDLLVSQEPQGPLQSAFPESQLSAEERLLHHPEFDGLCESLCGHGNHKLKTAQVREIWFRYIDGGSNRNIALALGINDTLVWRTVNTLTQWVALMDLDTSDESLAKVVLRDFRPKTDEAFIYASWRNSLWYDDENRKEGDSDRFFRLATTSIRNVLENPKVEVRIACVSDSDNLIVGYSVITGNLLHFVYVKADYRNKRIGSLLVPKSVERVSPIMTKVGRAIALKKSFIKENKENLDGKAEGIQE